MFILDSLLIGSLRFVLDKIAAAADAEAGDDSSLREQLLEAEMRLELGEITESEFKKVERRILARLRELRGARAGGLTISGRGVKVTGVEARVAEELDQPSK
jgi:hypothetical protein